MVFSGFVSFQVFMLLRFVFGVSGIVPKVLKMLVFPSLGGAFVGWLILVYLGLEGSGGFVFLVLVFFFVLLLFLFCLLCFCFVVGLFWVLVLVLLFCYFFCFFCFFVFLEGLRVR